MSRPSSINIAKIAEKAGVSTATVSRVINNKDGVSETLRLKIRNMLEAEGTFAGHVGKRGIKLAAVIEMDAPALSSYAGTILSGIADYGLDHGIDISTVFVSSAKKAEFNLLDVVRDKGCDGVILLFANTVATKNIKQILKAKIPVMVLAAQSQHDTVGFYETDPIAGTQMAFNHLWNLGHRNIAFLGGPQEGESDSVRRVAAFKDCLALRGTHHSLIVAHHPTELAQEAGYLQAQQALESDSSLTALIANNDEMAYGAMLACRELGYVVPDDISVIGFDDYPGSRFVVPPLTSVRQHLARIGHDSAKSLDEYIRNLSPRLPRQVLKPELIVRESTGAVKR